MLTFDLCEALFNCLIADKDGLANEAVMLNLLEAITGITLYVILELK